MNNLVLTLLSINKVGKKTTTNFIEKMQNMPKNEADIVDMFVNMKIDNNRIVVPKLEEVKIAREKSQCIIRESKIKSIKFVDILSNNYPSHLRYIPNAPVILFYKGNYESIINKDCVAVIGSRSADEKGLKSSYRLGGILSKENYSIVSGLALGCDEMAHKGCLDVGGSTIAVMPCGLDNVYPKENYNLAEKILNNKGCLISEYPVGYKSFKNSFVERDRIQSGLSLATIVAQSDVNSGTMHTVNFTLEQNRILACLDMKSSLNRKIIDENKGVVIGNDYDISEINKKIKEYKNNYIIRKPIN
ncbi:DNA-processing protein DprA [Clostridium sp. CCUG 7971]|uniref:DNA-processing protein DprA n=1 Tax=Clostridium sp. CCUG 7971 TaxID=2811414 RepID=UPI001ABB5E86|nr:DNA-processing protein DprA [Clostridium sp. CCUG 7971]MBO3445034.1 DNA-protecting protein DprA [Clostridium sp. CCUG 7971]